jgi:hypothetical protein
MERVCDKILELDRGKCFMHDFGGTGSYEQFKEVSSGGGSACGWGWGWGMVQG